MEPDRYQAWIDTLIDWADRHPDVLAMIGAGSTGAAGRPADEFSDHDIIVFTADGSAGALRDNLSWLPEADRITYVHVETVHGRGIIYDDGHLLEIAVIDQAELEVIRLNDYAVLVDKAGLSERLAAVQQLTTAEASGRDEDGRVRFGHFLQDMIVGANRYARGERLAGNNRIRGGAATHLLGLLGNSAGDNLDPHRRFETAHPDLAGRIGRALDSPLPVTAHELVLIAKEELPGRVAAATPEVLDILADLIDRLFPTR